MKITATERMASLAALAGEKGKIIARFARLIDYSRAVISKSQKGPTRFSSLKYLLEFECIGGECPDTCCSGMRVELSKQEFVQLKKAARGAPKLLQNIESQIAARKGLQIDESESDMGAYVIANEKSTCNFLDAERLCEIHGTLGHSALPSTCAQYPRHLQQIDDLLEASATLACPEIARLCLLNDDLLEFVESSPQDMPYRRIRHHLPQTNSVDHYTQHYEEVRSLFLELLTIKGIPLKERLFLAYCFADVVEDIFYLGTLRFNQTVLEEAITLFRDPETQKSTASKIHGLHISSLPQFEMARDILSARRPKCTHDRFNHLIDCILFRDEAPESFSDDFFENRELYLHDAGSLAQLFHETVQKVGSPAMEIIDSICLRYARHFILTHPFVTSPTLIRYLNELSLHLLLARFLLVLHPEFRQHAAHMSASQIESYTVNVFQMLTKVIFHVADFSQLLQHYLIQEGFLKLDRAILLLPLGPKKGPLVPTP